MLLRVFEDTGPCDQSASVAVYIDVHPFVTPLMDSDWVEWVSPLRPPVIVGDRPGFKTSHSIGVVGVLSVRSPHDTDNMRESVANLDQLRRSGKP